MKVRLKYDYQFRGAETLKAGTEYYIDGYFYSNEIISQFISSLYAVLIKIDYDYRFGCAFTYCPVEYLEIIELNNVTNNLFINNSNKLRLDSFPTNSVSSSEIEIVEELDNLTEIKINKDPVYYEDMGLQDY